jgi:hypothetical protein
MSLLEKRLRAKTQAVDVVFSTATIMTLPSLPANHDPGIGLQSGTHELLKEF